MRNGVVDRWDSRQSGGKTDLVVNMSTKPPSPEITSNWGIVIASIDRLRIVHGHGMLVRTLSGDVRRFEFVPSCSLICCLPYGVSFS